MPTSSGGIVYPSPTDDPDVPGDLQAMAASIELGNAVVTTGATAGTGWSMSNTRLRRIGGVAYVHLEIQRTGAALVPTAAGAITPAEAMCTLPAGWFPVGGTVGYWMANSQCAAFGYIDTAGVANLSRTFPGVNIATNIVVRIEAVYPLT